MIDPNIILSLSDVSVWLSSISRQNASHSERSILSEKVLVAVCAKSVVVPLSFSSYKKRKKSIIFYFFRDRDKRHFGTFGTTGGEHLLGDGGKILLCAAVSGLGAKVDSGPTEQVEEAAVGYPRALETEAAGVLGIALSGA